MQRFSKIFVIMLKVQSKFEAEFQNSFELLTKGAVAPRQGANCENKIAFPIKLVYTGRLNLGCFATIVMLCLE